MNMTHTSMSRYKTVWLVIIMVSLLPAIRVTAAPLPETDLLVEQLTSNEWLARKLARRQLWNLADPQSVAELVSLLADAVATAPDRTSALRLLGAARLLDMPAAVESCRVLLTRSDVPLTIRALVAQILALDVEAAAPARVEMAAVARELMNQGEDEESWNVGLRILGQCEPAEAWPYILEALDSADDEKRQAAAAALSEHRYEDSWHRLVDLANDESLDIREHAVEALGLYGSHLEVIEVLQDILENESDLSVCSRALEAAESLPPATGAQLLMGRFNASTGCGPSHRFAILSGLRRILRQEPALPEVQAFLEEVIANPGEPSEAGYAAAALGNVALAESIGGVGALDGLVMLTSKSLETPAVRYEAVSALGRLDDPRAIERLETLLGRVEEDDDFLLHLLNTLRSSGRGRPLMVAFCVVPYTSEEENPSLRRAAIELLAQFGIDYHAAARLVELLDDADPEMASLSHQGLTRIFGEDLGSDAEDWTDALESLPMDPAPEEEAGDNGEEQGK